LQILDNELEKLVLYKGEEGTIESDDISLMCPYVAEANIFDLVDALGNRNGRRAATLLQQKFNEGVEPFFLFSMFVRQFRLLILVKECADAGMKPPDIARTIKQHSFVVGKLYQQCRNFSLNQLEQIYRHLLDVDVGVKIGRNDIITALDLLVATLTV
jgi:DNA polymerase-3 subunit delta